MLVKYFKKIWLSMNYLYYCFHRHPWTHFVFARLYGKSMAHKENNTIVIDYFYDGYLYQVYLPFERKLVNKMINSRVEVELENGTVHIQQQPGIPYFISPYNLGAKNAKIYSIMEEKTVSEKEKISI